MLILFLTLWHHFGYGQWKKHMPDELEGPPGIESNEENTKQELLNAD